MSVVWTIIQLILALGGCFLLWGIGGLVHAMAWAIRIENRQDEETNRQAEIDRMYRTLKGR